MKRCPCPVTVCMKPRGLGVILQDLTKLADRAPDTVVGVQEGALAPNPGNDLIPGNNLVSVFKQKEKDLERDALQLQRMTATAQPSGMQIKLEAFRRTGSVAPLLLARKPWHTPYESATILHHTSNAAISANPTCI